MLSELADWGRLPDPDALALSCCCCFCCFARRSRQGSSCGVCRGGLQGGGCRAGLQGEQDEIESRKHTKARNGSPVEMNEDEGARRSLVPSSSSPEVSDLALRHHEFDRLQAQVAALAGAPGSLAPIPAKSPFGDQSPRPCCPPRKVLGDVGATSSLLGLTPSPSLAPT